MTNDRNKEGGLSHYGKASFGQATGSLGVESATDPSRLSWLEYRRWVRQVNMVWVDQGKDQPSKD